MTAWDSEAQRFSLWRCASTSSDFNEKRTENVYLALLKRCKDQTFVHPFMRNSFFKTKL